MIIQLRFFYQFQKKEKIRLKYNNLIDKQKLQ